MTTIEAIQYHVEHFGIRTDKIDSILLFAIEYAVEVTLKLYDDKHKLVQSKAHYLVGEDGLIYECMDLDCIASTIDYSKNITVHNSILVGVELDKSKEVPIETLLGLITDLCFMYKIPLNNIQDYNNSLKEAIPWFEFLNTIGANLMEKLLNISDEEEES